MISDQTIILDPDDINDYTHYLDQEGAFLTVSKKNKIFDRMACREEFAMLFTKKNTKIGFVAPKIDIEKLNRFFEKREKSLKLEIPTVFHKTSSNKIVIIEPAPAWLETSTSRGLFTLFIRGCILYYKNNFLDSLKKYHLTEKCIPAIEHFLLGNTKPKFKSLSYRNTKYKFGEYDDQYYNRHGGFVQFFANRTQEELNKLLVKP